MQVLKTFDEVPRGAATVCCIGSFDGVHLGHQHLISAAVDEARQRGMRSAVVTFFPHPRAVLGRTNERYLTLPDEKAALIEALGVDVFLVHEFTAATAHTRAEAFTRSMIDAFDMRSLWAGPDFAFGHRREGTAEWLRATGARLGFAMHVAEPLLAAGRIVSSTRVREALQRGDMAEVGLCLGRPYSVRMRPEQGADFVADVFLDDRNLWPAPGTYDVQVGGEARRLTIAADAGRCVLDRAVPAGFDRLTFQYFA